jgi:hypothetical protein
MDSVFLMHISNKISYDDLLDPKRPLIFVPGIRTSRLAIRKENGTRTFSASNATRVFGKKKTRQSI